ncbi:MAG: TlpA disulfide reductase family protein [Alphaproteobacteria bacterium]|nr:TlpA disulfide reductase family protein [Alphaproteobacteria bacterium]
MIRAVLVALAISVIVVIYPPHASAEGGKCAAAGRAIFNFQPTLPPRPVRQVPFVEGADTARTIADYRGRAVVLNFWATWCAPCVREMPSLDRLQAAVSGEGIEVLTLSEDRGGAPVIKRFYKKHGIRNLPVLVDKRGEVLRKMRVRGLPTTLLVAPGVDEKGRRGRGVGFAGGHRPGSRLSGAGTARPPPGRRKGPEAAPRRWPSGITPGGAAPPWMPC